MLIVIALFVLGFPVCLLLYMRERKRMQATLFAHQRRIAALEAELAVERARNAARD